jgi:hypothetical protein
MKKTDLKQLIREEIKKILSENLQDTPLNQIETGHYLVKYTTENRDGAGGEIEYEFIDSDKLSDVNPYNFWRGVAKEDYLFETGDKVISVEKI